MTREDCQDRFVQELRALLARQEQEREALIARLRGTLPPPGPAEAPGASVH
jgi:cobalamin biosynthesis Mg chelatase CobN